MRGKPKKAKIGLLRELTNGNLGNAAFEAAAVQHLVEYFPDADIYVCCIDSLEALKAYNVRLFPVNAAADRLSRAAGEAGSAAVQRSAWNRRGVAGIPVPRSLARLAEGIAFWARSYKFLRDCKLLILCGGGQLSDWWGGPWNHPFTLFMWTTLARLSRTRVVILNVGVEQVSSDLSRWFLKRVLYRASYRSFRDDNSRNIVEGWGVIGSNYVYPDLAFSLKIPNDRRAKTTHVQSGVIGISPMPYCDPRFWPIKDENAYRKYLYALAAFTGTLLKRGYTIMLFVSQVRMDIAAMRDLRELLIEEDSSLKDRILESNALTVDDFLTLLPGLDLVVASRMHAVLLSQLMGTPALAISYDRKVDDLMAGLGLGEFCVDIRTIEVQDLVERFSVLESKQKLVREALQQRVAEYRYALQQQYDAVFRA